jgi:hypothetical protein
MGGHMHARVRGISYSGAIVATIIRSRSVRMTGGAGRNRTADASLFRAALYRLSYRPMSGVACRSLTAAFKWV